MKNAGMLSALAPPHTPGEMMKFLPPVISHHRFPARARGERRFVFPGAAAAHVHRLTDWLVDPITFNLMLCNR